MAPSKQDAAVRVVTIRAERSVPQSLREMFLSMNSGRVTDGVVKELREWQYRPLDRP
jgi:transposase-like protein